MAAIAAGALPALGAQSDDPSGGSELASRADEQVDPQIAALRKLRRSAAGPTNVNFVDGFPRFVQADVRVRGRDPVDRVRAFLERYKDLYGQFMAKPFGRPDLDPNALPDADPGTAERDFRLQLQEFQGKPTSTPDLDLAVRATTGPQNRVVALHQSYKGLPVFGADLLVFTKGERVLGSVGGLLSDLDLGARPRLTDVDAEEAARDALDLRPETSPAVAQTHLVVLAPDLLPGGGRASAARAPRLAWRLSLGGVEPTSAIVDAQSGELLLDWPGVRGHDGLDDYDLDLEDANGNNALNSDCYWSTGDNDTLGDEDELNDDGEADPEAVEMWGLARDAYKFFHNKYGRHSYDNDGGQFELYLHASNQGSASWVGAGTDCDLIDFNTGFIGFDVIVHELTHGVADFSLLGSPTYKGQTGAIEESHSDTLGARADGNWLVGEDTAGGAFRSLSNPPDFFSTLDDLGNVNHPDQMSEFVNTTDDKGGVHENSGIPNKAAFLLAEGGTHPGTGVSLPGVSTPSMGWLTYMTTITMPTNASFTDNRALMMMWAQMEGWPSWARCSVTNAYAAVEVGNPDANCDGVEEDPDPDGDGFALGNDNCPGVPNPGQKDTDGDGMGDVCDGDPDEDGDFFPNDNCPGVANPDQTDANLNGIGKACDPTEDEDFDDDGVENEDDNCFLDPNTEQEDVDDDGDGDACDPDSDGDGWSNDDDNAPFEPNPGQEDSDGDGIGDVSDDCPEVADENVAWTTGIPELGIDPQPLQPDSDDDGTPDACDDGITINARPIGSTGLKPTGRGSGVDVEAIPGSITKLPLSPSRGSAVAGPSAENERLSLKLTGLDPMLKTWVTDDDGRTVARPSSRTGQRRALRFRPLAGHRYFLFLFFAETFEGERTEEFQAELGPDKVRVTWPDSPRPERQR